MAAATAPRVGVLARASARVSRVGFGLQSGWRTDGAASHLFAQPSVSRARPMWSRICVQAKASSDAPAERTTGKMAPERKEKQQLIDLNPPRGTRDFPPEDLRMRQWLFNKFSEVSRIYGFEEWDAPVLESEELYTRKAGEEITQQLYNFEDKGQRRVSLRPELTPSLARLALQKGKGLPLPAKWFAIGQCWRYERTTRGRRREHYQWNMDIIGVPGVEARAADKYKTRAHTFGSSLHNAEAELLAAIVSFFRSVGLVSADVGIRVSNRKVLQAVLERFGVTPEKFAPVCVVVDKIEKLPRDAVEKELLELGVDAAVIDGLLQAMAIRSLADLTALLGAESVAVKELTALFELAKAYGYEDWLAFDASVVRGLAYYTGTVFEAFDRGATLRAICGGGRYDRLLSAYGGEDQPMCGFGFGDAVIVELLQDKGLMPTLSHSVDDVVFALDESLRLPATGVAAKLRAKGRRVELVLEAKKMKWVLKRAQTVNAERLVLVGGDEWAKGNVRIKTLATFDEKDVPAADI